jgi:hypothetical protein
VWGRGNQAASQWIDTSEGPPRCPYCDRVMSNREHVEQGACNDCYCFKGYGAGDDD